MVDRYQGAVRYTVDKKIIFLVIYALVVALLALMFFRLPTSFLPTEDQGGAIVQFRLPPGATQPRSLEVQKTIEKYLLQDEAAKTSHVFTVSGIGGGGSPGGPTTGLGFVSLKSWDKRPGKENSADAITGRMQAALAGLRDAQVFALVPPAVRGLGQSSGFTLELPRSEEHTSELQSLMRISYA